MKHLIGLALILLLGISVSFAEDPNGSPVRDDNGNYEDHAGLLSGCVKVCNRQGIPVEGVQVIADGYGPIATTDQYGNFSSILPIRDYTLTFLHGSYPSMEVDKVRPIDIDLDIEHAPYNFYIESSAPDVHPDVIELDVCLEDWDIPVENCWLSNDGCYPFEYEVSFEILDDIRNGNPNGSSTSLDEVWDLIQSYPDILTNTGSSDISGIAMGEDEFYVSSSIDGTFSTFTYNGVFQSQVPIDSYMHGDSLTGLISMTNSSDYYLYGGNDNGEIFRFLPDFSEIIHEGTIPIVPKAIAYDWDNDYIYASDGDTSFYRTQPNGTFEVLAMAWTTPITGLAYCPLDPDGYTIYAHVDTNPTSIIRYNSSQGAWDETPVTYIYTLSESDCGVDIAFSPHGNTSRFMTMANISEGLSVNLWEGYPNQSWFIVEPSSGIVNPGEDLLHTITIDPEGHGFEYWGCCDVIQVVLHFKGPYARQASTFISINFNVHSNDTEPEGCFNIKNSPNPFNPTTTIHFDLKKQQDVTLTVFNLMGQEVAKLVDGNLESGHHSVNFDGSHLASGIYFYRIDTPEFSDMKKMVIMK